MGGACGKEKDVVEPLDIGQQYLRSAETAARNKKYEEALKDYKECIQFFENCKKIRYFLKLDELLVKAWLGQGDALKSQHKYQEAYISYSKAQQLGSTDAVSRVKSLINTSSVILSDVSHAPVIFKANPETVNLLNVRVNNPLNIDELKDTTELSMQLVSIKPEAEQYKAYYELAMTIIEFFARHKTKSRDLVAEVIPLIKTQNETILHALLAQFIAPLVQEPLLEAPLISGLSEVLEEANPTKLKQDDLVQSLIAVTTRLLKTHQQFKNQGNEDTHFELLNATGRMLDAMVDIGVEGLRRVEQHEALYEGFEAYTQGRLGFEAQYCRQALVRIPNDESKWARYYRKSKAAGQGLFALWNTIKGMDPSQLLTAYENLHETVGSQVAQDSWYDSLRYAKLLLNAEHLMGFEYFIKNCVDRRKPGFVFGIIQCLAKMIQEHTNIEVRLKAMALLEQIFEYSEDWETKLSMVEKLKIWEKPEGFMGEVLMQILDCALSPELEIREAARSLLNKWRINATSTQEVYLKAIPDFQHLSIRPKPATFVSTRLLKAALIEQRSYLMTEQFLSRPVVYQSKLENWHLPASVLTFIGRGKLLEIMAGELQKSDTHSNTQVVACTGLGGIGKTQLVLHYAKKAPFKFKAWFVAETAFQLQQAYYELSHSLGYRENSIDGARDFVKAHLENNPDWLLIFDNVANYEALEPFIPVKGGSVLISSRNNVWPNGFKVLPVNEMDEKEAVDLLKTYVTEEEGLSHLANMLGYLPLALAQAGAYIHQSQISIKEYLELYKSETLVLLKDKTLPQGTSVLPVATTWNVTLAMILQENPISLKILTVCAYLGANGIPKNFLQAYHRNILKGSPLEFIAALRILFRYSLLKFTTDGYVNIHRLVQTVLRHQQQSGTPDYEQFNIRWLNDIAQILHQEFLVEGSALEDEKHKKTLASHLKALEEHYHLFGAESESQSVFADILSDIGYVLLYQSNDFRSAQSYYEHVLSIQETCFGKKHIDVARTLNELGVVYHRLGNYIQAKISYEQSLAIREEHLGKDHPEVADTLVSLGNTYGTLTGDCSQKRTLQERALPILEQHYGGEHPKVAFVLRSLSAAYGGLGDFIRKKELQERALLILEKQYGPDHPEVAIALVGLSNGCWELESYQESLSLLERALKIHFLHYSQKENSLLAAIHYNLGVAYRGLGEYQKAKESLEKSERIYRAIYENEKNPTIVMVLNDLAECYRLLSNPNKAKELLEPVLKDKEACYGKEHIDIAKTLLFLGSALRDLCEYEAEKLAVERCYGIFYKNFGENNPYTKKALILLQECQQLLINAEKARDSRSSPLLFRGPAGAPSLDLQLLNVPVNEIEAPGVGVAARKVIHVSGK